MTIEEHESLLERLGGCVVRVARSYGFSRISAQNFTVCPMPFCMKIIIFFGFPIFSTFVSGNPICGTAFEREKNYIAELRDGEGIETIGSEEKQVEVVQSFGEEREGSGEEMHMEVVGARTLGRPRKTGLEVVRSKGYGPSNCGCPGLACLEKGNYRVCLEVP